jgi:eukaryotic-like serine/threonine-protein kinase
MISMPQVTGQPQAAAVAAIQKAGLTVGGTTAAASTSIGAGIVISTNPVAGTSWPQNKSVTITVSAGPPLQSFVGQQLSVAQAAAQSGGFKINAVADASSTQPANTITSQSPAPGTPITPGEVVTVHYSNGPPQVPVPNVVGLPIDQATQILQQAGFQVNVLTGGIFTGHKVAAESPTGTAPKGSTITLTPNFAFP